MSLREQEMTWEFGPAATEEAMLRPQPLPQLEAHPLAVQKIHGVPDDAAEDLTSADSMRVIPRSEVTVVLNIKSCFLFSPLLHVFRYFPIKLFHCRLELVWP